MTQSEESGFNAPTWKDLISRPTSDCLPMMLSTTVGCAGGMKVVERNQYLVAAPVGVVASAGFRFLEDFRPEVGGPALHCPTNVPRVALVW